MLFSETTLCDALLVDLQLTHDNRGFFARSFSVEEFALEGYRRIFHSIAFHTLRAREHCEECIFSLSQPAK